MVSTTWREEGCDTCATAFLSETIAGVGDSPIAKRSVARVHESVRRQKVFDIRWDGFGLLERVTRGKRFRLSSMT